MARRTWVAHADATWDIVQGCSPVSPGCENCNAALAVHRFARHPNKKIALPLADLTGHEPRVRWRGKTTGRGVHWTGDLMLRPDRFEQPLRWRKPARVVVCPLGDLFHEDVPDDFLLQAFRVMHVARRHRYQLLTRRADRMLEFSRRLCYDERHDGLYLAETGGRPYLPMAPHIWPGVAVENQEWADRRIPPLLKTQTAGARTVVCEPMIGPVNLREIQTPDGVVDCLAGPNAVRWVMLGGEIGPRARVCDVRWFRAVVEQVDATRDGLDRSNIHDRAYVWVKQLGTMPTDGPNPFPYDGTPRNQLADFPEGLKLRHFPHPRYRL